MRWRVTCTCRAVNGEAHQPYCPMRERGYLVAGRRTAPPLPIEKFIPEGDHTRIIEKIDALLDKVELQRDNLRALRARYAAQHR
jgi:hypothetical protein